MDSKAADRIVMAKTVTNHKFHVIKIIHGLVSELLQRAAVHDDSKLTEPEVSGFSDNIVKFSEVQTCYLSKVYVNISDQSLTTKQIHWAQNAHHPEYHEAGINGMSLLDIIEMVADWIASCPRYVVLAHAVDMIDKQRERFNIDDQLYSVIINTLPVIIKLYEASQHVYGSVCPLSSKDSNPNDINRCFPNTTEDTHG